MALLFRCQSIQWNGLFPRIARRELTRSLDMGHTSFFVQLGALANSPSLRPPNADFWNQLSLLRVYGACILVPRTKHCLQKKSCSRAGCEGVHGGIAKLPVDSQLQAIYSADIVPDRAKVFRRTWWSRR